MRYAYRNMHVINHKTHPLVAYHMTCTHVFSAHVISGISPLLDYAVSMHIYTYEPYAA